MIALTFAVFIVVGAVPFPEGSINVVVPIVLLQLFTTAVLLAKRKYFMALMGGAQAGALLDGLAAEVDGHLVDLDLEGPAERGEVLVGLLVEREPLDRVAAVGLVGAVGQLDGVAVVLAAHRADRIGGDVGPLQRLVPGMRPVPDPRGKRSAATAGGSWPAPPAP